MKLGEMIGVILVSTGLAILISTGAQFYFNNFSIIEAPSQEPPIEGYYSFQETSEEGGEQLEDSDMFLRDSQQGINLYYVRDEKEIKYYLYNNNEDPRCVYAEVLVKENINSIIFFHVPLLPEKPRDFGIIRLIPDKEAFYVFNWYVTGSSRLCRGEVQA
jgi:hypothetical protein